MKNFFWIGIIILIIGAGTFAWVTKPWVSMTPNPPKSSPQHTISVAPEYKNIPPVQTPNSISSSPVSSVIPQSGIIQAQKKIESGLYQEAIVEAKNFLSSHPKDLKMLELLHVSYLGTKNFYEAEQIAQQLVEISNTPAHQIYLVNTLLLGGKVKEAKAVLPSIASSLEKTYYQLIIAIFEEDTPQIKLLAEQLANTTDPKYKKVGENVLGVYKTYSSFRDGSPHYLRMMLANILNILEFHTLVTQFVRPTLIQYDDYRDAWILAGNAYLNLKNFRQAEEMLSKAVSLDPSHVKSPYYLAIALAEQGQTENAIEQFENAVANGYQPLSEVERYMGDISLRQKNFDEAFGHYQVVLDEKDVIIDDYAKAIFIALDAQKSPDLGLKLATQAAKKFPNEARSYALLAWSLVELGSFSQAFDAIEKGRKKDDTLPDFYLYAGKIYEKQQQNESALSAYKDCFYKGAGTPLASECAKRYNNLREIIQQQ